MCGYFLRVYVCLFVWVDVCGYVWYVCLVLLSVHGLVCGVYVFMCVGGPWVGMMGVHVGVGGWGVFWLCCGV